MKSLFIKILLLVCMPLLLLSHSAKKAEANVPDVIGKVVTRTGAPVVGVWVKWRPTSGDGIYRLAQTNNTGTYQFPATYNMTDAQIQNLENNYVDTDLDGTADTYQLWTPGYSLQSIRDAFSCGDNPHYFTVINPVTLNGTFTQVTGVILNNSNGNKKLPDIVYTSAGGPPPTKAPTPTSGPPPPGATYSISGNIFLDYNRDGRIDNGEFNYQGSFSMGITPNSGTITTNPDGTYSITGLPAGTYTVSYVSLPHGYQMTHPLGSPPSYQVKVGPGCNTNNAPGASCGP